jgi:hypothetical protein
VDSHCAVVSADKSGNNFFAMFSSFDSTIFPMLMSPDGMGTPLASPRAHSRITGRCGQRKQDSDFDTNFLITRRTHLFDFKLSIRSFIFEKKTMSSLLAFSVILLLFFVLFMALSQSSSTGFSDSLKIGARGPLTN